MSGSFGFKDKKFKDFIKKFGIDDATTFICQLDQEQYNNIVAFTKEDLKPGMVVELRNGKFYMVMPDANDELFLISENGYYPNMEEYFDSSLKYKPQIPLIIREQYDIVKVYNRIGKQDRYSMSLNVGKEDREILWERKESKYKVGDKFFFEELSEIKRRRVTSKLKVSLYNVIGEIKSIDEATDFFDVRYRVEFLGYKEDDIGIALFDDYILDNYGKKINC